MKRQSIGTDPRAGQQRPIDPRIGRGTRVSPAYQPTTALDLLRAISYPQAARGLKFPLEAANGRIVLSEGVQHIKECVAQIIQTQPGEYPFFPDFACDLKKRIFGPTNATALAKHDIQRALEKWEPRVSVRDITAETSESDIGVLKLRVDLTINDEAEEHSISTEIRRAAG